MSRITLTDEELMHRVQQGDRSSYQALFERHQSSVYGYLVRRTREGIQAEDLFQETWLKVYRNRGTYKAGQRFKPWLFRIASNTFHDALRTSARRIDEVELHREHAPRTAAPAGGTLDVEAAIASLPDPLREAFLLGPIQGFDHHEVAEMVGISPDNARARISRARAALRAVLGQDSSDA
jgi:RNA polymerase sigma-70 factor (ECF subfamily)